MHRTLLELTMA